jgi:hypothetical protein
MGPVGGKKTPLASKLASVYEDKLMSISEGKAKVLAVASTEFTLQLRMSYHLVLKSSSLLFLGIKAWVHTSSLYEPYELPRESPWLLDSSVSTT